MLERKHIEKIDRKYRHLVALVLDGAETEEDYADVFEAIDDALKAAADDKGD